jgi:hypothetical protein
MSPARLVEHVICSHSQVPVAGQVGLPQQIAPPASDWSQLVAALLDAGSHWHESPSIEVMQLTSNGWLLVPQAASTTIASRAEAIRTRSTPHNPTAGPRRQRA